MVTNTSFFRGFIAVLWVFILSHTSIGDAYARDFPEPYSTIDPLHLLAPEGRGAVIDWALDYQVFRDSALDDFQVNLLGAAGLFDVNRQFAVGLRYGKFLMTGPGGEDKGTPHFAWLMNSVQFEYGIHAAFALSPRLRLLGEYSRASNHPFIESSGGYTISTVAYDRIALGAGVPGMRFAREGRISASLRLAYAKLWDFWEARDVDATRVEWLLRGGIQATHPLPPGISPVEDTMIFAELYPDLFTQRNLERYEAAALDRGFDANFAGSLGLRFGHRHTSRHIDIYLDTFISRDSEMVRNEPFPVGLVGLGVRTGNASAP
ncbi:MAG: hypothetical protein ACOCRN_05830 [Spirochaetia bacterium]